MITREEMYVQPTAVVSCGGIAGSANVVNKAAVNDALGPGADGLPSWIERVAADFGNASEAPSGAAIERYGKDALAPLPLVETFPLAVEPLQDLVRSGDTDPRYDVLWPHCSREILNGSKSAQAAQKPAIGRVCIVFRADEFALRMRQMLRRLARDGEVQHGLRRHGFTDEQIAPKVRIVVMAGAEGGTGSGVFMPASIIAASVAREVGVEVEMEAWVAFRYREAVDQEATLRVALGAQFANDLEVAQTPGRRFRVKTLSGVVHSASGDLFTRCMPFDGNGRLYGNSGGLALAMGEAAAFRSLHRVARDIDTGHAQNILSRTRT